MRIHPGALVHGRVVLTPSVGGGPSTRVLASLGPRRLSFNFRITGRLLFPGFTSSTTSYVESSELVRRRRPVTHFRLHDDEPPCEAHTTPITFLSPPGSGQLDSPNS